MRSEARRLIRPGTGIIEICERIEKSILRKGGKPAFPCNVCVNEVAAHYSSPPRDRRKIPPEAIVKIDLGVHVDGYIADTAVTVSLKPEYDGMAFAAEKALEQVIKSIRPNVKTKQLGETAKNTIEQYGFKPVWNLTGHQMKRFILHTGKSIPNVPKFAVSRLNEGEVFAVEPFLTLSSGLGEVGGLEEAYIFRYHKSKPTKSRKTRELLDFIRREFRSLPFSKRWLEGFQSLEELNQSFKELIINRSLSSFPVLVEKSRKPVAQAEHTVIVTGEGCIVTTL